MNGGTGIFSSEPFRLTSTPRLWKRPHSAAPAVPVRTQWAPAAIIVTAKCDPPSIDNAVRLPRPTHGENAKPHLFRVRVALPSALGSLLSALWSMHSIRLWCPSDSFCLGWHPIVGIMMLLVIMEKYNSETPQRVKTKRHDEFTTKKNTENTRPCTATSQQVRLACLQRVPRCMCSFSGSSFVQALSYKRC